MDTFFDRCRFDMARQQQKLDDLEKEINALNGSRWNKLTVYSHYMPELIRHLQGMKQRNQFHRNPYGPLGRAICSTYADKILSN